jgi:hypothetical protein
MIRRAIICFLAAGLFATGCSTAKKNVKTPKWATSVQNSKHIFVGQASQAGNRNDALKMARQQAFAKVARQIGVKVKGKIEIAQKQSKSSGYSYEIKNQTETQAAPIRLKTFEILKQKAGEASGGWKAWIKITVPDAELARLSRQFRRKTALMVKCTPGTYCPTGLREKVSSIANDKYGYSIVPKRLRKRPDDMGFDKVAKSFDAAYALVVHFNVTDTTEIDGEHYAGAEVSWKYYDLDEGKVTISKMFGPVKGAHFSKRDAIDKAVNKLMTKLEGQKVASSR